MSNRSYSSVAFANSQSHFDGIAQHLSTIPAGKMEHGQIEEYLRSAGREMLRSLFQDHLDLHGEREVRTECVEGADGVQRTHVRERQRTLATIFGDVEVRRLAYSAPETPSLCPRDVELNLPPERYSDGLRRGLALEAARGSFDEAVQAVERATGVAVPKRQAEQLAQRGSSDFKAFYDARKAIGPEATRDPLVMSLDGKGIVMRKEHLSDATLKEMERRQMETRTPSKDERLGRKRMATVAAVYSIAPHTRTAEDIIGRLDSVGEDKTPQVRPHARNKRVWASVADSAEHVTRDVFKEALHRDPEKKRDWLALVDGCPHQIERVKVEARRHRVAITMILDIIHVLEYLWKAAHVFHDERDRKGMEAWVRERALNILKGRCVDVAAGIRRSATLRDLSGTARKTADTCADYLLNHAHMMRYNEYLAAGYPIASGVIEGACRYVVKDRMDITGARWGLKGAEAVLRLRSLRSSGDFEDYWRFHQRRELIRNHLSAYSCPDSKRKAG